MPAWKAAAVADRRAIARYIAQDSPRAAVEIVDMIVSRAGQLDTFPRMGKAGRVPGTLELVAHPNYVIVYRLVDGQPEILRVLHTAMQWP